MDSDLQSSWVPSCSWRFHSLCTCSFLYHCNGTLKDVDGVVLEDSSLEQVRPEDFIVEIVQEGYGMFDDFIDDWEWVVEGYQVLHEFYDICSDDFLEFLGIESEDFDELEVISALKVLLQHQYYNQTLVVVIHLFWSACVEKKLDI